MSECALWKSPTSFFRSAICGLSTAARVMVFEPPPPPPAPPEHAAPTSMTRTPTIAGIVVPRAPERLCGGRRLVWVMRSHLSLDGPEKHSLWPMTTLSMTTLSDIAQIGLDCNHGVAAFEAGRFQAREGNVDI